MLHSQVKPSWMWISAGVLTAGGLLAVRYVGFRAQVDPTGKGFTNFIKTVCYFKWGTLSSVVSMYLIKLTNIPEIVREYPKTTLLITICGMLKFQPDPGPQEHPTNRLSLMISSIIFFALPSLYYSKHNNDILVKTFLYTFMVVTVCFVVGTIIPMENNHRLFIFDSLGYEVSRIGIIIVIVSAIDRILFSDKSQVLPRYVIHVGTTVLFSGILIDDIQQVKIKFLENAEEEPSMKSIVERSVTIFFESVLVFGRIADILYCVLGPTPN